MSKLLQIFLLSAVPIVEQRGAIPMGIIAGLNPMTVFWVSFFGSILPVPFILLSFNKIFTWMKKYKAFEKINNLIERKIDKNSAKLEKYKEIGLITFIAIIEDLARPLRGVVVIPGHFGGEERRAGRRQRLLHDVRQRVGEQVARHGDVGGVRHPLVVAVGVQELRGV